MGFIHQLNDDLINKIAAGEVVERPANVVKELVENSIDAGARHIDIELQQGGTELISVRDDGMGMEPDDLKLAFCRHATSKISQTDDLFNIKTMGFRGEALASIAAVSRVSIQSRYKDSQTGYSYKLAGGQMTQDLTPWEGPQGTTLTISDLFFNIPARRAFLKNPTTETAYVLELVQALALAYPDISMSLTHNGKEMLRVSGIKEDDLSREACLRERCRAIFSQDVVEHLLWVSAEDTYGKVEGLVSPPGYHRASNKYNFTFVNRRWVKDKILRMAIQRGYHSHLLKGQYPICYLWFECHPHLIDVNVHPSKTELRFQYAKDVQNLIAIAIRQALRSAEWSQPPISHDFFQPLNTEKITENTPHKSPNSRAKHHDFFASNTPQNAPWSIQPDSTANQEALSLTGVKTPTGPQDHKLSATNSSPESGETPPKILWHDLVYLGCIAQCYLLFKDSEDRLLVMDQHAFHERILYEKLSQNPTLLQSAQKLLVPECLNLSPQTVAQLESHKDLIREFGFQLNFLSTTEVEVLAVPSLLDKSDLPALIEQLAETLQTTQQADHVLSHDTLATMACHAAVKAGEELPENELRSLLKQAEDVDFFHNCPHGRPVMKWWTKNEMGRWFERS